MLNFLRRLIAAEISSVSRYYDRVIQWAPLPHETGKLLDYVDAPSKVSISSGTGAEFPDCSAETEKRTVVLLNGNLNHSLDIQELLSDLKTKLSRTSRVIAVVYNPYLRMLFNLCSTLGIRKGETPFTFVTRNDLAGIAKISGFELVRIRPVVYSPFRLLGLGSLVNRLMPIVPGFRWLSLTSVAVLRPVIPEKGKPSISILIPARNERGNLENALKRMPTLGGADIEVIFVEGHSSDGTWEEIQRLLKVYGDRFKLKAFQQTGKGKSDAVRLGFAHATGDLMTILDADLTMPPEKLQRFYDAYCWGLGDFVNGSRLVYPMEGEAMRFLNRLGNIFFAKSLSAVLETPLGDSLCGTKLVTRHDYDRFIAWRNDFGDFDPFGDFELLFPAAILALGMTEIPVYYRARTYGSTSISRFYHGSMLLKMTLIGLFRIKLGRIPSLSTAALLKAPPKKYEYNTRTNS